MAGIGIIIKMIGADRIIKSLISKDTVSSPAGSGIKKLAMSAKAELIKSTVVAEGTARSNIAAAPIQYAQFSALITHGSGPGSKYIPFLETGTSKMGARHMEGGKKIICEGEGMFTYVKKWLSGKLKDAANHIAKDIEGKF